MSSWSATPTDENSGSPKTRVKFSLPEDKVQPISKQEVGSWGAKPISLEPFQKGNGPSVDVPIGKTGLKLLNKGLPIAGGVLGAIGGPGGSAAGAGFGALASQGIDRALDTDNPTPLSPKEAALTFGTNAGLAGVGGKVSNLAEEAFAGSPIQGRLAAILANTVFGQGVRSGEASFSGSEPSSPGNFVKDFGTNAALDFGLGKAIKFGVSKTPEGRSELPTEQPLSDAVNEQRARLFIGHGPLPKDLPRARSTSEYGSGAQTILRGKLQGASNVEKAAYNKFQDQHEANNIIQLPQLTGYSGGEETGLLDQFGKPAITPRVPQIQNVDVKGPITTTNATLKAAQFKPLIDGFTKGANFEALPPEQQRNLKQLAQTIDQLVAGTPTFDTKSGTQINNPILAYRTAKQIKTDISQDFGGEINKTLKEGGLTEIAKALDKDIDYSVENLWKNGAQAKAALDTAHDSTTFKKTVFNNEIKGLMYGDGEFGGKDSRVEGDATQVFKAAYQNRDSGRRLMTALGPENQDYIKGDYFDNYLLPKMFGKGNEKFNPRKLITELENPNSFSRDVLSANERNGLSQFAKAAESSNPTGNNILSLKDRFVSIAAGHVAGLTGIPGVRSTVRFGTQDLISKMKDNPQIANYATRLIKTPSNSTQGQQLTKLLMRGMRGAEVTLVTDDGEKKGTVTDNGLIKF